MTITKKPCTRCIHFKPPEDPKYHEIPEFAGGSGAYDFGQGFMHNSRCAAVVSPDVEIPELIKIVRAEGAECGPDGLLFEENPPSATLIGTFINAIIGAFGPKI